MTLAQNFDNDPGNQQPRLSADEQRIADAVVRALSPALISIDKRMSALEQDVKSIDKRLGAMDKRLGELEQNVESIDKRMGVVEQEIRGMNKILADNRLIIDYPEG